jgi:hypothetical protein
MPTDTEQSISKKSSPEAFRQLLQLVAICFQQPVFLGLEIPLLLVSSHLPSKYKQPQGSKAIVVGIELSCVGFSNW